MRSSVAALAFASLLFAPSLARADTPASADGVTYLPPITVYGRPNKPSVVIVVTRPTAASAARAAHEEMRAAWIERSEPATLHPAR